MKKLFMLLATVTTLLLIFGCSDSPQITGSSPEDLPQLVQRPEFIETRPPEVVQNFVISGVYIPDESFEKKPPPPPPDPGGDDPNPNPPHKYAYVVGISDYEGTINDLEYCDDDAAAMRSMLQGEGFSVTVDMNRNATAQNIVDGLTWLANQASPGDEIAFYYSGHGDKFGGDGSSIISTDLYYIPHAYVMSIINSANCSKIYVALDACKIGNFLSDGNAGSFIMTGSNSTYSYDAPDLQHGAWTYYLLEGAGMFTYCEDIAPYAEEGMAAWASIWHVRVSPAHTDKYDGSFDL